MTKAQKKKYYNVIKQALERAYPIIIKDPQSLGISEDTVDSKIAEAISLLKGDSLPQDSDTLKELADKIVANAVNDTTVLNEAKAYTDDAVSNLQTTIELPTQAEIDEIFEGA
jgi:predicted unusual protein kinase regulating ubiquinone biosynthesis (AarF/ABC1/UbiB family)